MKELTYEEVSKILDVDLINDNLIWKVFRGNTAVPNSVAGWKHSNGYIYITINKKSYRAHRVIFLLWYGKWPKGEIDHLNGIKDDNWIFNLEDVSKSKNQRNRTKNKNNKSGTMGVYKRKDRNRWWSEISVNNKTEYLGSYNNIDDAIAIRKFAEMVYCYNVNHGREARQSGVDNDII